MNEIACVRTWRGRAFVRTWRPPISWLIICALVFESRREVEKEWSPQSVDVLVTSSACTRGKVISRVLLLSSVCLFVCQHKKHRIKGVLLVLNTFKLGHIEKLPCRCFFLRLKSCVGTMGTSIDLTTCNVQRETMVSMFLGFTVQHAFVRRQFVPLPMETHA